MQTRFTSAALAVLLSLSASICEAQHASQSSGDPQPPSGRPKPDAAPFQPPQPAARPRLPGPDQPGPWDQDVLIYRVSPDLKSEKLATFERSGVPTLARLKDNRLAAATQHFPAADPDAFDKVAMRFSTDDGKTWTAPQVITMTGLPEGMRFPFDPTLVPLPEGRVRLYFTSRREGPGKNGGEGEKPAIYSGISEDCVHFTFEPGMRFGVEGKVVIDCAAAIVNGKVHLFSPDNGSEMERPQGDRRRDRQRGNDQPDQPRTDAPRIGKAYHAISDDGLKFTRAEDVTIEGQRRWLGNALALPATSEKDPAKLVFIGTGGGGGPPPAQPAEPGAEQPNRRPTPRGGLWLAESTDGATWKLLDALPVPGADPGAAKLADGSWLVIVTGPPREGTPSARQRNGRRPVQNP